MHLLFLIAVINMPAPAQPESHPAILSWDRLSDLEPNDLSGGVSGGTTDGCPGSGSCCEANGTPGCDDVDCCDTVCGIDAFCCDVSWDSSCADEAADLCDGCGGSTSSCPSEGDCCAANGTPGCDDAECCKAVCAVDPFCCDILWDSNCAIEAAQPCNTCGCNGECCVVNGSPGCEDFDCCASVCAVDSFCCDVIWDDLCASQAVELCGCTTMELCPGPGGDCCSENGSGGCDDVDCCSAVCNTDPFCCTTIWDATCVQEAVDLCGCVPTFDDCPGVGDCCFPNGTPGCADPDCCGLVCSIDAFCCDISWDSICADEACELCDCHCGGSTGEDCPGNGDCCASNGSPGCDDAECCDVICSLDSFCCNASWDSVCASEALTFCLNCGGVPACLETEGDCCSANGSPGCAGSNCCADVCSADPYCCETNWDILCADQADKLCDTCPTNLNVCSGFDDCCEVNSTSGCGDVECCETVCAIDPYCCDVVWDVTCADEAIELCDGLCTAAIPFCPSGGGCCQSNDIPGCDDGDCCHEVCRVDPFCCSGSWDDICAEQAVQLCDLCGGLGYCPPASILGSLPRSGTVDARQPFVLGDPGTLLGIGGPDEPITLDLGTPGAAPFCFSLCETDEDDSGPNNIASVTDNEDGTYTIVLDRPITTNAVTTISYIDGSLAVWTAHPANADGDSVAGAADVLEIVDIINGATPAHGIHSGDIDHSGVIGASDVLRVIDLLNGASGFPTQFLSSLPQSDACTPELDDDCFVIAGNCVQCRLDPPEGDGPGDFGVSVSVDGDAAVVGNSDGEIAYVYRLVEGNWNYEATLTGSLLSGVSHFGGSVAISDDVIVVGTWQDNDAYVYHYDGTEWVEEAILRDPVAEAGDNFGRAVAVDNDRILIGAAGDDNLCQGGGGAFVYRRIGGEWVRETRLKPELCEQFGLFGDAVALHGDVAVVGSDQSDLAGPNNSGTVFVYRYDGSQWNLDGTLVSPVPQQAELFGHAVAVHGDVLVVGTYNNPTQGQQAGVAYVFRYNGLSWQHEATLLPSVGDGQEFGWSVAVEGDRVLVGALHGNAPGIGSGAVYVYQFDGDAWNEVSQLYRPDLQEHANYGWSIDLSGDTVVVGASNGSLSPNSSAYVVTSPLECD